MKIFLYRHPHGHTCFCLMFTIIMIINEYHLILFTLQLYSKDNEMGKLTQLTQCLSNFFPKFFYIFKVGLPTSKAIFSVTS